MVDFISDEAEVAEILGVPRSALAMLRTNHLLPFTRRNGCRWYIRRELVDWLALNQTVATDPVLRVVSPSSFLNRNGVK